MIYQSPAGTGGNGSSELSDLSPDELVSRVEQLEDQLENARRRAQIESRRQTEVPQHPPTRSHPDGYDVLPSQRVAILIDVQNMYYAARNLYNSKLEFSKLLSTLARGRHLVRAIAYIVERPGMEQEKFVEVLRRNGYEVRKKILIERSDGSQKGDWDLGIALDAIALSDKVDSVVLVTGDGDFVTLVHFLHNKGMRVEVASFPETTALELIRSCNYYHRLNEKVLLPGGQFQAPPRPGEERDDDRDDRDERDDRPSRSDHGDRPERSERPPARTERPTTPGGPRPGRSPVDDMELDEEDDDFSL